MNILTLNLLLNVIVFWLAIRLYLIPRLATVEPRTILVPILLLHATRHLGLMFLAPGATYPGLPPRFAYPAAFGDLLAAILALVALPSVLRRAPTAKALVWIFNVEGSLDLVAAIALATLYNAPPYMGPAYWIPAFWVPALLVTHYVTFRLLRQPWPQPAAEGERRVSMNA
ncbi:MAG: hypothetical protein AB7V27_00090 [Candidatus Binatia bacterium]